MLSTLWSDISEIGHVLGASMLEAQRTDRRVAVLFVHVSSIFVSGRSSDWETVISSFETAFSSCLGRSSSYVRSGASEFVAVLSGDDVNRVSQVCSNVVSCLSSPLTRSHTPRLHVSVGCSVFPYDGETVHDLLRSADAALYRSKIAGRDGYVMYSSLPDIDGSRHLETEVRRAWERGEFVLSYQPIVDTKGVVHAFEALVRWHHPDAGLVGPDRFIPLCESTGLMIPLGEWILESALTQYSSWRRYGVCPPRMSVNVSACQLLSEGFVHNVGRVLSSLDLPAECLEIEITESALFSDPVKASQLIAELRAFGVRVALDDFGTGTNTLSYLRMFHVDALKIDRSFVTDLLTDSRSKAIVRAVIDLSHSMGMTVVAEGIESSAQYDFLVSLGCDEFQGYHFSRPLDSIAATELLRLRPVA